MSHKTVLVAGASGLVGYAAIRHFLGEGTQVIAVSRRKPYDGAVALGCVIRGDTIHFEIVSEQSARGVMDVSIARKIPIGNGILTVNNEAQANVRANLDEGDKGGEAARAALTLIRLKRAVAKR